MMAGAKLEQTIARLSADLEQLKAEADIRRLQTRYMFLCDTPCPEPGVGTDEERISRIMELYAEDAVWEGVGDYYRNQSGRHIGKDAIRSMFQGFWGKTDPKLLLNVHYLTSEQIHVDGDQASGQWVHCQPWLFSDGHALLRSSRLNNLFQRIDGIWKITRTRTENVFVAPLRAGWAEQVPTTSVLMS